jgi:hypothetical protein
MDASSLSSNSDIVSGIIRKSLDFKPTPRIYTASILWNYLSSDRRSNILPEFSRGIRIQLLGADHVTGTVIGRQKSHMNEL